MSTEPHGPQDSERAEPATERVGIVRDSETTPERYCGPDDFDPPEDPDDIAAYEAARSILLFLGQALPRSSDGPADSADMLSCAAREIIRAYRGNLPFAPAARARIIEALGHAYTDAELPQRYPRNQFMLGIMAMAALVDPERMRARDRKACRQLAWDFANMFANDMDTLRRSGNVARRGFVWAPATCH